jgi:hypothetical protein
MEILVTLFEHPVLLLGICFCIIALPFSIMLLFQPSKVEVLNMMLRPPQRNKDKE